MVSVAVASTSMMPSTLKVIEKQRAPDPLLLLRAKWAIQSSLCDVESFFEYGASIAETVQQSNTVISSVIDFSTSLNVHLLPSASL